MRIKGTKYPAIDKLPSGAMPVSRFADKEKMAVGYVYIKYERHFNPQPGKKAGEYPGYVIRCFQGSNYVIPQ